MPGRFLTSITLLLAMSQSLAANPLSLNGSGTREAFFVDLYTCELYLETTGISATELLQSDAPARVQITVHGNPPGAPPENWAQLLREELSDKMFRLTQRHYRDLEEGDKIMINYVPDKGTNVEINGEDLFTDPGRALMSAILEQWIGEDPVSRSFKSDLLGQ